MRPGTSEVYPHAPKMIYQIFNVVFPIFAIVLVGYLYGHRHPPDMAAANQINMDIFIPALIFHVLSSKDFHFAEYQTLAIGCVMIVLGSGLIAWPFARLFGYKVKTFVPPMMFSNSGNLGLPLMLFAFGEEALPAAVLLFIVTNLIHFSLGIKIVNTAASIWSLLKTPIILATLAGLLVSLYGVEVPELLAVPIEMVGRVAIPLMLFSLGVRLIAIDLKQWRIGVAGAIFCPISGILLALLVQQLLGLPQLQYIQLLLFGALPPAVLNYIIAERYDQQPGQVASIVMLGNLSSIIIIPITLAFVL